MVCNICETGFNGAQSVVAWIEKKEGCALLYIKNQGRNVIHLRRIIFCRTSPSAGTRFLYLRPAPDPVSWLYPSAYLEPGIKALFFKVVGIQAGSIIQAQAEYMEIEGRSRTCSIIM